MTAKEILEQDVDGVFLSNGPGDPSALEDSVKEVKALLGKKPIFGICMGHQILAQALGAKIIKLKFGHHGANHPVWDNLRKKVIITSQNHGFSLDPETLPSSIEVTHRSLNDESIEGIRVPSLRAYSIQFHPEANPGPHDAAYLFEPFLKELG